MPVELNIEGKAGHKVLVVRASGKLSKGDYQHFLPQVEGLVKEQGKARILFAMHDFHGWEAGALWEDLKFDVGHFDDIERLGLVGEKEWEERMALFCEPFTNADIRYFDQTEADQALQWIKGD
ncbi:MAG TPA: STAS/SEC14 domain-containing protein [Blastocatellia bacterium]